MMRMVQSAIHSAMAFGVSSVGEVDGCGELHSVRRRFLFDKPCTSIPFMIYDRQECN
jgi:hypothetical protein